MKQSIEIYCGVVEIISIIFLYLLRSNVVTGFDGSGPLAESEWLRNEPKLVSFILSALSNSFACLKPRIDMNSYDVPGADQPYLLKTSAF